MKNMENKVIIYSDGGSRNNPGPSAIGAVIKIDNQQKIEIKKYIGEKTNNYAEYKAILEALKQTRISLGQKKAQITEVNCFLDSELVVKQLNKEYKIKNSDLLRIAIQINNLIVSFKKVTFRHIPRSKNKQADRLVNEALNEAIIISK